MGDEQNKPNFWTTLPGILTGVAAILTAVGSLLVVVHPFRSSTDGPDKTRPGVTDPEKTVPKKPEVPPPRDPEQNLPPNPEQKQKATAVITENDGPPVTVDADSLIWFGGTTNFREFNLNNGQSFSFDKIKVIDVLTVEEMTTSVQVTLTDGKTYKGSVDGGHVNRGTHFEGKNDDGRANVPIGIVKQVLIQH